MDPSPKVGGEVAQVLNRRAKQAPERPGPAGGRPVGRLKQGGRLAKKGAPAAKKGAGESQAAPKISWLSAAFLIVVALVLDLISLIPIVNIIVAPTAWIIFGLWLYILGVGLLNMRRLAAPIISLIIEVIPAVSVIPSLTLAMIITIVIVRFEEKSGIKLPTKKLAKK
ncbi:MAG: hypothetical protein U9M92_01500 [Patescibacteria group bacterium]|nr:hypothetical protein [Patescibacteria group bacterium]